jgi:hypothetical protein
MDDLNLDEKNLISDSHCNNPQKKLQGMTKNDGLNI